MIARVHASLTHIPLLPNRNHLETTQALIDPQCRHTIFVISRVTPWYFSNVTLYLVISLIIAALLRPLTNRINDFHLLGQHIPRWLAILISYSAIVLLLVLLGMLYFPLINDQILVLSELDLNGIYIQIQEPVSRMERFLLRYQLLENKPGSRLLHANAAAP
jgi:predicted PurR-regulated permease PerM